VLLQLSLLLLLLLLLTLFTEHLQSITGDKLLKSLINLHEMSA
jgi:hypothetical protein